MVDSAKTLLIHATNVTGLGASRVAWSLLEALAPRLEQRTHIYVPADGLLSRFRTNNERVSVHRFSRRLPNALSRAIECVSPAFYFPETDQTLVLGDNPLRGRRNQVLFVQQANLIKPDVNRYASRSATFRFSRALFERHLPSVTKIIVQSEPMKESLERSYAAVAGRIEVIPHPAPSGSEVPSMGRRSVAGERVGNTGSEPFRLFYPAAGYLHKNHAIFGAIEPTALQSVAGPTEFVVTLTAAESEAVPLPPWVTNIGRVTPARCRALYGEVDGLFFPSVLESCGLPLLEAMTAGLPIVCADLPYARWLCGDEAIFFDPGSGHVAATAVAELTARLQRGWQPDWRPALAKLPRTWDDVAAQFLAPREGL